MRQASRTSFIKIKRAYSKLGMKNVRLTQSSILLARTIVPTTTNYLFPILESDNSVPVLPEEIRLNINDEFISYDVGYYLYGEQSIEGAQSTAAGTRWTTYAPAELSSAFAALDDAWIGDLSIEVNKVNYIDKWDLKKHNYVPRTQYSDSVLTALDATQASIDFSIHGTIPMQPMITFSGAKKNTINIELVRSISPVAGVWVTPDADDIGVNFNRLALFFRGMLAQNASKFQGRPRKMRG